MSLFVFNMTILRDKRNIYTDLEFCEQFISDKANICFHRQGLIKQNYNILPANKTFIKIKL